MKQGESPPQRRKRKRKRARPEAVLVGEIVQALESEGVTVLRVGQGDVRKAGNTTGTPDLFLFAGGRWLGVEVKTRRGRLSDAQRRLYEAGLTCVARSVADVLALIAAPMVPDTRNEAEGLA